MRTVLLRGSDAPHSPRIYRKRLGRYDKGIRAGEVVAVRMQDGRFVGRAFFTPQSVIALRILDRDENGPAVDEAWFRQKIGAAHELRVNLMGLDQVTDAYRVVHAEGDGLSGLIIDRYADVAVIEVGSRGMFAHLESIEAAVRAVCKVKRVVVRSDPAVEKIEGFRALERGAAPVEVKVQEHGIRYHVDCRGGHKTGFFVDQRESRLLLADMAADKTVLDLCCYTGGFSLAAAAGGAAGVIGVDLDEAAIAQAKRNAELNDYDVTWQHADVFDYLRPGEDGTGPRAQIVVLDPPKLASRRDELPRARKKSMDLHALALAAVEPGGVLLTYSCTGLFTADDLEFHVRHGAIQSGRNVRVLHRLSQPPDHPVHVDAPEGRYLCGALCHVS